ncbi:hypothetical protein AXF42_Ash003991 [Apostasia shenzhenica]|uniref:Uncharacterized protein n=1 Tax=Apostasia shenzhenica TaxID=1088818 RepID=A0A2I0AIG4_9ASPA|nr:hypothetical protein AXF42_Ash003991 [Apostasia shenzhenica]
MFLDMETGWTENHGATLWETLKGTPLVKKCIIELIGGAFHVLSSGPHRYGCSTLRLFDLGEIICLSP